MRLSGFSSNPTEKTIIMRIIITTPIIQSIPGKKLPLLFMDYIITHKNKKTGFLFFLCFKNSKKGRLWQFHISHHFHPFFSFFLFFKQLSFTCHITTVTFCNNIFTERVNSLPGNYLTADCTLNWEFKLLPGNFIF